MTLTAQTNSADLLRTMISAGAWGKARGDGKPAKTVVGILQMRMIVVQQ
jgi:hypothetical protein